MTDLLTAARTLISGAGDRPPESACEYCGDGRTVCVYARDFEALVEAVDADVLNSDKICTAVSLIMDVISDLSRVAPHKHEYAIEGLGHGLSYIACWGESLRVDEEDTITQAPPAVTGQEKE